MIVSVIGAGSWGTALSLVLADSGHEVRLWAREPEVVQHINQKRHNPVYLSDITLPEHITCFETLKEATLTAQVVLIATPSHAVRSIAGRLAPLLNGSQLLVSVVKGIENETFMTMTQVLAEVMHDIIPEDHIATLYGPSHAEEVALRQPTAVVVAAYSSSTAAVVQNMFSSPMFRVYVNRDVRGVEISGSIKNIMAIAAGIAEGAGFGDNAIAALITRGLQEACHV